MAVSDNEYIKVEFPPSALSIVLLQKRRIREAPKAAGRIIF